MTTSALITISFHYPIPAQLSEIPFLADHKAKPSREKSCLTLFHYVRSNRFVFVKPDVPLQAPTPDILTRQSRYSSISPDSRRNVPNIAPLPKSAPTPYYRRW